MKAKVVVEGTGQANVRKLMQPTEHHPKGRLAGFENPFDPNPNPPSGMGHAIDSKTGMRTGLTPQEYLRLWVISQGESRPVHPVMLVDSEKKAINAFVKNPPKDLTESQKSDLESFKAAHPEGL